MPRKGNGNAQKREKAQTNKKKFDLMYIPVFAVCLAAIWIYKHIEQALPAKMAQLNANGILLPVLLAAGLVVLAYFYFILEYRGLAIPYPQRKTATTTQIEVHPQDFGDGFVEDADEVEASSGGLEKRFGEHTHTDRNE